MKTELEIKNKAVAVLGVGESGVAASRLLQSRGARVTAFDESQEADASELRALNIGVELGAQALEKISAGKFDLAVISPGIELKSPLAAPLVRAGVPILGEIELASRFCQCPIVALTGTNGKTTTTELVTAVLQAGGKRAIAAGNIGRAFSSVVDETADLDFAVLEVSSFQLETIERFRPAVSVYLNLTPDHLDRYASIEEYRAAKWRLFENQTEQDWAVVQQEVELPRGTRARRVTFSAGDAGADYTLRGGMLCARGREVFAQSETQLAGPHNAENLLAALAVGDLCGVSHEKAAEAMRAYRPQPHRCELVAEVDGVTYINDSKATNIDAVEKALAGMTCRVVLIAGGKEKGLDYSPLTPLVRKTARACVLIGQVREKLRALWSDGVPCETAESLPQAVERAARLARSGDVVLLSPGTSSYDMFSGYEERGDVFRAAVNALKERKAV